ncbi:uncharacterized protein LOC100901445 [Galendromus occidentalis]|uniref:Uncharacterized protein LOC100901445 n=1 Tax=Galendromus occidentalis TaxID=34638 RepID=A0AAJ7L5B5_9ACAR|nr:uncharacterized protein LOC100901445 [Galendromus occidentalis]
MHKLVALHNTAHDVRSAETLRKLSYACRLRARALIDSEHSLAFEFSMADLLYRVHQVRTEFHHKMLDKQSKALKYLSEADFIQHLFFCHSVRALPTATQAAVPIFIENVIKDLLIDEVALICFACYKCQYSLPKPEHWTMLIEAFQNHKGPLSDISMTVFAKYFRYQKTTNHVETQILRKFLDAAESRQQDWTIATHIRVANAGTQSGQFNEAIVTGAMRKMMKELGNCRVKDISMCLYSYAFFDLKLSPSDAGAIIEELNKSECHVFHVWFIRAVLSLALLGYYDESLLIKSFKIDLIDVRTTHLNSRFDLHALWTVCNIKFPNLVAEKKVSAHVK